MRSPTDLWEALGSIDEEETHHVLTRLFAMYEQIIASDPNNKEALKFFQNLDNALSLTEDCNLNRR
jgi:hypothetical protein